MLTLHMADRSACMSRETSCHKARVDPSIVLFTNYGNWEVRLIRTMRAIRTIRAIGTKRVIRVIGVIGAPLWSSWPWPPPRRLPGDHLPVTGSNRRHLSSSGCRAAGRQFEPVSGSRARQCEPVRLQGSGSAVRACGPYVAARRRSGSLSLSCGQGGRAAHRRPAI